MGNFLNSLPRTILAILALVVGFVFIILNDPPKSICTVQLDLFKDSQKHFLYSETIKNIRRPPDIDGELNTCRSSNSPGGCNELFFNLRRLTKEITSEPSQCGTTIGAEPEVNKYLWRSYRLMVELAWGSRAPAGYESRFSWMDSSDLALFCDLKDTLLKLYGEDRYRLFQEEMFQSLPQASMLTRDQVWQRTILSIRCDSVK